MSVALASAWRPRGEISRLIRLLPTLTSHYTGMIIALPPDVSTEIFEILRDQHDLRSIVSSQWSWGRHLAVRYALETSAGHVQYADMDRLLRWVETRTDEWRSVFPAIRASDCLVIGRTEHAYGTHPRAIEQTERIPNWLFSQLLGKSLDLSAGSKGFSRLAAEFLLENSMPGRALGTDGEWPVLLYRAGFKIDTIFVDGLDWESADRYQHKAADASAQRSSAEQYDRDPQNWAYRVQVAQEIVSAGIDAWKRLPDPEG